MLVSEFHNFAFYHIPKCGGTSIINLLKSLNISLEQIGKKHEPLSGKQISENATIFTNIRNPFHRIYSIFCERKQRSWRTEYKNVDFPEFFWEHYVKEKINEFRPIHEFLFINNKLPGNVYLVKLEKAKVAWPMIIDVYLDREIKTIPHLNSTAHGDPMEFYDKNMIGVVKYREWWAVKEYNLGL